MSFEINNTQTVWLPFSTNFKVQVSIFAGWNDTVAISDPHDLTNLNFTGSGQPMDPSKIIGAFTTPESYGDLPAYPVNVQITNDQGQGGGRSYPSYVSPLGWAVTSFDSIAGGGHNNLYVNFQPNS